MHRLKPNLSSRLVFKEQATFVLGRSISDNSLLAQEILHSLEWAPGLDPLVMNKLDIERVYDRIRWDFLERLLRGYGFDDHLFLWILGCVTGASFAVLINGSPTAFFHSTIGLHQACPLSPYLFILCFQVV